jgi:hypothetical protein
MQPRHFIGVLLQAGARPSDCACCQASRSIDSLTQTGDGGAFENRREKTPGRTLGNQQQHSVRADIDAGDAHSRARLAAGQLLQVEHFRDIWL